MKTLGDFPRPGRLIATVFQGAKPPATDRIKCAGKMATTSMAQTSAAVSVRVRKAQKTLKCDDWMMTVVFEQMEDP